MFPTSLSLPNSCSASWLQGRTEREGLAISDAALWANTIARLGPHGTTIATGYVPPALPPPPRSPDSSGFGEDSSQGGGPEEEEEGGWWCLAASPGDDDGDATSGGGREAQLAAVQTGTGSVTHPSDAQHQTHQLNWFPAMEALCVHLHT